MIQETEIVIQPHKNNPEDIKKIACSVLKIKNETVQDVLVLKSSIDARKRKPLYRLRVKVFIDEKAPTPTYLPEFKDVSDAKEVIIIGAGPAGLFAGLKAIELGLKPIIVERGKDVKERRRDLASINKEGIVNSESNYCFGEGGAGTYSDGKLYTRSKKRGDVKNILNLLVGFGADDNILSNAHPHIGTNKLPQLITEIRETILKHGGEVLFDTKLTDIFFENNAITGIELNGSEKKKATHVVLATGHSARDIFHMLHDKKVLLEFKPFALGVRIEHPQKIVDNIQYHCEIEKGRGEHLPPASYNLVAQTRDRGVFSFCMCPGGIVAPCATNQEEVVTNGWSPSKRNNPYANSGIVVEVKESDLKAYKQHGALKGLVFQAEVERACWEAAGKTQAVPAQRLIDFIARKPSADFPKTSYIPGLTSVNLHDVLPKFVSTALRDGFIAFGKKMYGFMTNEAVIHAPESRTSSPVRIPRDKETMEHVEVKGLYPCGEGAGYAGGIVSAAIDGQKCIEKVAEQLLK